MFFYFFISVLEFLGGKSVPNKTQIVCQGLESLTLIVLLIRYFLNNLIGQ